ncbi:hypothetical protein RJ639_025139 [Escallonia herrerae]|uniref:Cytochrome P450 n=1 Tax=Escallonia herrerae TaxID=1293975 RepID=A0AA88UTJ5_9ASTE|nr:hypothetical protein RJ639_025139 [Escallonia herrerae]
MDLIQFPFSAFTLIFLLLLFLFLFKLIKSKAGSAIRELPPGPWKLPLIGNMLCLVGSLPHRGLSDLARKYGPIMHLQLGESSTIVISTPRAAKEVLKTHDLAFATRPELLASKIILYDHTDIAFCPYGDYWRQMRKVCTLELLSAKKVRSFRSIREDENWKLVRSIHLLSGSTVDLSKMITSVINAITCRATFGNRCKDQDVMLKKIKESTNAAGGFDVADLFPSLKCVHFVSGLSVKLLKIHQKVDEIFDGMIKEHQAKTARTRKGNGEGGEEDLVDVLLRLKESGGLEFPITTKNIKAVIMDMFSAGTETSSTTLEWAMSELIRNPGVMQKAQSELREVLKGKKIVHEADIQELRYLKLVIKETLRLHPVVPLLLPRECRQQCEISGYNIPVKTKVIVNAWAIGRDPEYWHNAETFEPERFENSPIDFTGNSLEYIPFGAGRRICPGISFGLANVELPLAQLLYHFNWKLPDGVMHEDLDMSETFGATSARKTNLLVVATSYSPL